MRRTDIKHLHYIASINNVPSILKRGILCHNLVNGVNGVSHTSIANKKIQQRRSDKTVRLRGGGSKPLHAYVNLYFTAHNWMLKNVLGPDRTALVCVLEISSSVLEIPGTVVTTCNAAKDEVRFYKNVDVGLNKLDNDRVFHYSGTKQSQAEALIPDSVSSALIIGARVGSMSHYDRVKHVLSYERPGEGPIPVVYSHGLFHPVG